MSETSVREAEIAVEQKHLDVVYARVAEIRDDAEVMRTKGDQLAHGARNEAVFEQAAMLFERDVMVRHATQILRTLDAEHEGLVFGRLDSTEGETQYVGRLGVRDGNFDNLVTDWRAPAAAPFYQATAEHPMDVVRRRVIRSTGKNVVDIDDDLLMPDARAENMAVVGEGALMASLTRARGENMRDIIATIQKEQDVAIRAPWRGVTEITGGPGTGKTAVALHRVAYLLYRDRRRMGGTGVLVVGPSTAFTSYISRVLPSMGEDSVELRSLGEVVDGFRGERNDTAEVAALKGSLQMRRILKRAIREAPADAPTELRIVYKGQVLKLVERDLAAVRKAVHNGRRPPNQSRVDAAEALLDALWRKADAFGDFPATRAELLTDLGERLDFHRFVVVWWQLLGPLEVLATLGDRRRLAAAAGKALTRREVDLLADSWADLAERGPSIADVALLDELRVLLGKPPRRRRRSGPPSQHRADGRADGRADNYDEYSHIVVDEAQDLSPMQWRMVGRRGRYASWTVVGDPVQSSWPDPEEARRARVTAFGGPSTEHRRFALRTNYRNSAEIFALAHKVVTDIAQTDELPIAVRSTGQEPLVEVVAPDAVLDAVAAATRVLLADVQGTVGVITSASRVAAARAAVAGIDDERVKVVDGLESKGLEYDAVVLAEPGELVAESLTGPRTLYVALTRATQRLTVVTSDPAWPA